jgi:hypothetical protein
LDLRLSQAEQLTIAFYSLSGKKTVVANRPFQSGDNHVAWKPETLSPGINILMIRGKKTQKTFKLMAMR